MQPVLRISNQCGRLSEMAGMDAREAATPARDLGKSDPSFDLGEPERYRKDAPNAQVHIRETGYFALDTAFKLETCGRAPLAYDAVITLDA
jgi:hypothetical protein